MTTATEAIAQMRALLGVAEQPAGSNVAPPVTTWYGPPAGAWCFAAGTLVTTPDGLQPIESIEEGDVVLTGAGHRAAIEAVHERDADVVRVTALGLDGSTVTADHPYWALRRVGARLMGPMWIDAGELRPGDLIGYPILHHGEVEVDLDVAYLLGRYMADGWRRHGQKPSHQTVQFHDAGLGAEQIRKHLDRLEWRYTATERRTGTQFEVRNHDFWERCASVGDLAHTKQVASEVFGWDTASRQAFLAGYVDGDGHKGTRGEIAATTTSRALALSLAALIRSLGHSATMFHHVKPIATVIEGRTVNQRPDAWIVGYTINPKKHQSFEEGCVRWSPVRSVVEAGYETVYDITVEGEHTFLADGAIVHNCAKTVSYALSHAGMPFHVAWCPSIVELAKRNEGGLTWRQTPARGDLVLYSFGGQRPDHVGMVEQVNGDGTMLTIEGNTTDACRRHRRSTGMKAIVGYARPGYTPDPPVVTAQPASWPAYPGGTFRRGSHAPFVRSIQHLANAAGCKAGTEDGVYGPATEAAVKCWQRKLGIAADGRWGPKTQAATERALKALRV